MLPGSLRAVALAFVLASSGVAFAHSSTTEEKVDINRATLTELEQLPGITPIWAKRIMRFRPYRTKLDLVQKGILPADIYSHIRESIVAHQEKR